MNAIQTHHHNHNFKIINNKIIYKFILFYYINSDMSFINAKISTTEIREGKTNSGVLIDGLLIKDNGLTANNAVTVNADLVIDTDTLFVNSTDNYVGIGTNNPSNLLDVNGIIQSYSDTANNSRLLLSECNDSSNSPDLYIKKARGTHSSKSAIQNNDSIFNITPYGYDGTSYVNTCGINYSIDGNVSTNTLPTKLTFQTGETNSKIDRMTIKPNGYIGINTSSPTEQLYVDGNVKITGGLTVSGTVTSTSSQTLSDPLATLATEQTGTPTYDIGYLNTRGTSSSTGFIWFENDKEFKTIYTQDDATVTNVTIYTSDGIDGYSDLQTGDLKTKGNVIINKTLSVAGNVNIDGNVTINGALNSVTSTEIKLDDPLLLFGNSQDGNTPTSNIGFIGSRGNSTNIGFIWNEENDEFRTIYTSDSATNNSATISTSTGNNGYAQLHTGSQIIENTLSIGNSIIFNNESKLISNNCVNSIINNRKLLGTASSSGSSITTELFTISLNNLTYNSVIGNSGGLKVQLIISDLNSKTTKFEEHYIQIRYRYDSSNIEHFISTCLIAFESNSNNNIIISDTTLSNGNISGGSETTDRNIPVNVIMTPTYTGNNPTFYAYYTINFTGSEGISINI